MKKFLILLALVLLASQLCSCGGGGGGDSFVGAAKVSLSVDPNKIDTADQSEVRMMLSHVHPEGILLKLKFPVGLEYVRDSAILKVDGSEDPISPSVNKKKDNDRYLVFFLSQDQFGQDAEGEVRLQLTAVDPVAAGMVEVDPDVNDPRVRDSKEFDIDAPEFVAEDAEDIQVVD